MRDTAHRSEFIYILGCPLSKTLMSHWTRLKLSPTNAPPIFHPTQWFICSITITSSATKIHHLPSILAHDHAILFFIITHLSHEPWTPLLYFSTLHHRPYLSFIPSTQWFQVIVRLLIAWLVNRHMSWPLEVYRVATIVRFTLQLCNLRTLLHPSQSSVLLQTSRLSISRAPSIWFALLHSCLSLESSITLLGFAPSPARPRIAFIVLSTRSMEDTQWKLDP